MIMNLDYRKSFRHQSGLTIVEILVALTLGLFLMTGVIQIYVGSQQTYRFQDALSRIQENGRFAIELLNRDIRMAGFNNCPQGNNIANVLNNPNEWWKNFGAGTLIGYEDDADTFPGKAFGTNATDRVAGTDAIVLIRGGGPDYSIVEHNPTSANFKLNQLHNLTDGSIVMVCDLEHTAIMQLTNVSSSNVTIVHNTGTEIPGNCTKGLGLPVPDPCTANGTLYVFDPDESDLVEFVPVAYYIGVSDAGTSLYRMQPQVGSNNFTMVAQELIEGVQDMEIVYGEDTNGDSQIDQYRDASAVTDWTDVLSVRVNLLVESLEDNITTTSQSVIFPADTGNTVTFGPNDRHLRQAFSTTVGIRNRLP